MKAIRKILLILVLVALLAGNGCTPSPQKTNENGLPMDSEPLLPSLPDQEPLITHHPLPYISFARSHSLYIDEYGALWGRGFLGNILAEESEPNGFHEDWVRIMDDVVQARASEQSSAALKQDGSLWIFGGNTLYEKPTQIGEDIREILYVTSGSFMVLSEESEALVYRFVNKVDTKTLSVTERVLEKQVLLTDTSTFVSGGRNSFFLQNNGDLYGYGQNLFGVLGNGKESGMEEEPVFIMDSVRWVHTSGEFTFAVTNDHQLVGWGRNNFGQLGIPAGDPVLYPVKLMDRVKKAYAYHHTAYVIMEDDSLWTFGREVSPHLRQGDDLSKMHQPVKLLDNVLEVYTSVPAMSSFRAVYALQKDGTLYGWGKSSMLTGNGSDDMTIHQIMQGVSEVFRDSVIYESLPTLLRNDQSIWTWGLCPLWFRATINGRTFESKPLEYVYVPTMISPP